MKTLLRLNFFALGLPFALALLAIFNINLLILPLLSTIVTGGLQVLIALILLFKNPVNIHLCVYFVFTILFFILWLGFNIEYWLFALPPLLAIYFTYIVAEEYKKSLL